MSFRIPIQQLQIAPIGSNGFLELSNAQPLDGGNDSFRALVAHSGFVRRARCAEKLLLNVNNARGAFYPGGPLTQLVRAFVGQLQSWPRPDLLLYLQVLRVRTTHLMASNGLPEKIYTIWCVALPAASHQNQRPTPFCIFFNLDGFNISVGAYYRHRPAPLYLGVAFCRQRR
jgi:hypothetical protein